MMLATVDFQARWPTVSDLMPLFLSSAERLSSPVEKTPNHPRSKYTRVSAALAAPLAKSASVSANAPHTARIVKLRRLAIPMVAPPFVLVCAANRNRADAATSSHYGSN